MLTKFVFQFYILITIVTLSIVGYSFFTTSSSINVSLLYFIAVLFIPFLDKIIHFIANDSVFCSIPKDWKYKIFVITIGIVSIIFMNNFSIYEILTILYIIVSIVFLIEERYSFTIALFLLFLSIVGLILNVKDTAETLSIYTYYFLVIGTLQSIINGKLEQHRTIAINIANRKKYSHYFYNIFLIAFIVYCITFYLSVTRQPEIIGYCTVIIFLLYICFRFTGNSIKIPIKKI